jgi:hypothetical protein
VAVDERFVLRGRATAPFMKSRMGTLVTNIVSEMVASSGYVRLHQRSPEPVLALIARNLAADEGLGQTSLILSVLVELVADREASGGTAGEVLHALRDLERARSLRPGARPLAPESIGELSAAEPRIGLSGQIEMKLLAPVFAGQVIEYRAVMTHTLDAFARFEVEAEVGGVAVARGLMTGVTRPLFQPERSKS